MTEHFGMTREACNMWPLCEASRLSACKAVISHLRTPVKAHETTGKTTMTFPGIRE